MTIGIAIRSPNLKLFSLAGEMYGSKARSPNVPLHHRLTRKSARTTARRSIARPRTAVVALTPTTLRLFEL